MAEIVTLGTRDIPYADLRTIYRGGRVRLDPAAYGAVDRAEAVIAAIVARGAPVYGVNTGFGKLASVRIDAADLTRLQRNIVLSHAAGVGESLGQPVVRLIMALKAASLAQGASGVRRATLERLLQALERGLVPIIPGQGSVGASGDLAPLAHLAAALFLGAGEIRVEGQILPAMAALAQAGLQPLDLGPKEGLALLNGTQVSTALALAGLFETERVFQAALVTGALATDAARGSDGPFDPRIQALRRHRGQIETAASLRTLLHGSAIRASHLTNDDRIQDPYCLRCQPQVMGACLDLLSQAAATLTTEANGVSDNPLVFTDSGEVISGGNFHAEPVAFAADIVALALCEIGSLAERRVAMLTDPALSGLPAFLTPRPGLNSGFMLPQVTAAALVAENRQRATPASVDSIPTSANQEDHVSMATHGARRLLAMAENSLNIVAIELLAAAQGCDFHAPLRSSERLERVRALLRAQVAHLEDDRFFGPEIAAAAEMVRSGAVGEAAGLDALPILDRSPGMTLPDWLTVTRGDAPLLVSLPHTGIAIPAELVPGFISLPLARQDADWFVDRLYDFAAMLGATIVHTAISRSVIDVNRDPSGASLYPGQATTGLCPTETFDGEPLYHSGQAPDEAEIARRCTAYFEPYHQAVQAEIDRLRARHPRIALYDCHSIRSAIPRLFDGILPQINIGTNSGASCAPEMQALVEAACAGGAFSHVVNGRFRGGWITRHFGQPAQGVHAVQIELACRAYLRETPGAVSLETWPPAYDPEYAAPLRHLLVGMLTSLRDWAGSERTEG